jgi:hypothetical protein
VSDARFIRGASQRYGVPEAVIRGLIQVESGGNAAAVSPVGAFGKTQFMPGTARTYHVRRGTGRRAVRSQIYGGAHYLHDLGYARNPRKALASYNAGPGNYRAGLGYAGNVLRAARHYGSTATPHGGGRARGGGGTPGSVTLGQVEPGGTEIADMLRTRVGRAPQVPQSAPAPPAFSARPVLPAGYTPIQAASVAPQPAVSDLLAAAARVPAGAVPQVNVTPGSGGGGAGAQPGNGSRKRGTVRFAAGADRPGVRTKPAVGRFVARVAGVVGHPLTVGTGTRHSRLTTSGNVSDHWSGHAADIPATGRELIRIGRAALVAAGMSPARARKQNGGLYNVNGHQVIFNTHIGGDHTNHVHVSAY